MRSLILLSCVSMLASCFGSPSGFQKQDTSMRGSVIGKVVTKTTDGVTYAAMRADETTDQIFEVNDIEELAGSSLIVPPGALAISVSMNVQEAAPLATTPNAVGLQLGSGFVSSGAPIVVQADKNIDFLKPMTISLPLPASTQLMLADPYENLVVLYKVAVAATDEVKIGALLRSMLTVSNGAVIFTTSHLGAYQVAFTEKPVRKVQELPAPTPILTKKEEAKLLTVDAGYDKETTQAEVSLDARTTSAVSFKWEKVSGTGDAVFSAAQAEDSKVTFSKDGSYVLRLSVTNDKGEGAKDDIAVSYDPWPIATIAVNFLNEAADGVIEFAESTSAQPILSLTSPEAAKVRFSLPLSDQMCDAGVAYGQTSVPTAASLTADGSFIFCVAFENFGGKTYYAKSPVVTRSAVPPSSPTFTSLSLAGDAADGYINDSEKNGTSAIFSLNATGVSSQAFSAALPSATPCNGSVSYASNVLPTASDLPADGSYVFCVKLTNVSGDSYGKSVVVERDTVAPTATLSLINEANDGFVNASEIASSSPVAALSASGHTNVAYSSILADSALVCDASKTYSQTVIPGINTTPGVDGAYALCARATDAAGNAVYAKSPQFVRDTNGPAVNVGADITTNVMINLDATASGAVTFMWTKVSGPSSVSFGTPNAEDTSVTASVDGTYVLRLTATDSVGNSAFDDLNFIWDTTPPTVTINNSVVNVSNSSAVPLSGTCSDNGRMVNVSGAVTTSATCSSGAWSATVDLSAFVDGSINLNVDHNDAAGNAATQATRTLTKDTVAPSVDVGPDVTVSAAHALNPSVTGATTYSWSKKSGPGTLTFSAPTAMATTVTASADGVYVIRLTATDASGNGAYDEMSLVWDTGVPVFTSLAGSNEAADGYINQNEIAAANPIWALSASDYVSYFYTIPLDDMGSVACDGSKSYTEATIPRAMDLPSDGSWVICVKLMDAGSNVTYGKSQVIIRDSTGPVFTALDHVNDASDGFINAAESGSLSPLWTLMASGYDTVSYTLPLDDSVTVNCTGGNTYNGPTIPAAMELTYDAPWIVCVKLSDAAGNFVYAKSVAVVRDTAPPDATFSVPPTVNIMNSTAVAVGGACSDNGLSINISGLVTSTPSAPTCIGFTWNATFNFAVASEGSVSVTAQMQDAAGNIGTTPVNFMKDTISPVGAVEYKFPELTDKEQWSLPVATLDTASYRYKYGPDGATTPCNIAADYQGSQPVANALSMNLDAYVDGPMRLCLLATDSAGNEQPLVSATSYTWEKVTHTPTVTQVAIGGTHACALFANGRVKCWGANGQGQLGQGNTIDRETLGQLGDNLPYVDLGSGKVEQIALGQMHSCALMRGGEVRCWGYNAYGNLGQGDTISRGDTPGEMGVNLLPTQLGGPAIKLVAGSDHTCALLASHDVKCWGHNMYAQLGLGDTQTRGDSPGEMGGSLPVVNLGTGLKAKDIAAGMKTTCAILMDSTVKCWGEAFNGKIGTGSGAIGDTMAEMGDNLAALNFGTGLKVRQVALGAEHSCFLFWNEEHQVKCIGWGVGGRLGYGSTINKLVTDVAGTTSDKFVPMSNVKQIGAGIDHTCALLMSGEVKCWGNNNNGELGTGTMASVGSTPGDMISITPIDLGTGLKVVHLSTGFSSNCALLDTSRVKCWGNNSSSQLGNTNYIGLNIGDNGGEMGDYIPPVPTGNAGLPGTIKLASGHNFACAIVDGYNMKCWGGNLNGQLGQGNTMSRGGNPADMGIYLAPIAFGGLKPVDVSLGGETACAIFSNGQAKCWGLNSQGQLGLGTTVNMGTSPSQLVSMPPLNFGITAGSPVSLSMGGMHACALLTSGKVKCWGANNYGQLGLETMTTMGDQAAEMGDTLPFVNLGTGQVAVQVATAAMGSTCAVLGDHSLKCWGLNTSGILGDGSTTNRGGGAGHMTSLNPIALGGQKVTQVAMGDGHACAILANQSVKCWGANNSGQLGDGSTAMRLTPTAVTTEPGKAVKALALGQEQSCAHYLDGSVKCWGKNHMGQLGQGNTLGQNSASFAGSMIDLGGARSVTSITARGSAHCALTDLGFVKCWGQNDTAGPLGVGHTTTLGDNANEMGNWLPFVKLH